MARILVLIGGHLSTAPRPFKEATALRAAGHDVLVAGCWFAPTLMERDKALISDFGINFKAVVNASQRSFLQKVKNKYSRFVYTKFGIANADLLGHSPREVLKFAREYRADLTIVHSEATMWVGKKLLDEGFRVGVDMEDWFSEDLPAEARRTRPVELIRDLEQELLVRCKYALATSNVMATRLAEVYTARKPTVIRNVFPASDLDRVDGLRKDRPSGSNGPSLHWFSQTIGPGRGLEILFEALGKMMNPPAVILRGELPPRYAAWLAEQTRSLPDGLVRAAPTVPNGELLSRIAEHDIGLALETSSIPSRDLTITNKYFQYLQGGLAMIATNTSGQAEAMAEAPSVGELVVSNDVRSLVGAMEKLTGDQESLHRCQAAARAAAIERFSWEEESKRLVALADEALSVS